MHTFPTSINLPYLHLPSLLPSNIPTCIKPSYQPINTNVTMLKHPVKPIYLPYFNQPSLFESTFPIDI